jgi:hypothetical protein
MTPSFRVIAFVCFISSLVCESESFIFARRKQWRREAARKIFIHFGGSKQQTVPEKNLDGELISIAFFSFLHQAAIPFSDLVHGSSLSEMDATSLGAMGVARTSQVRTLNDFVLKTSWQLTDD